MVARHHLPRRENPPEHRHRANEARRLGVRPVVRRTDTWLTLLTISGWASTGRRAGLSRVFYYYDAARERRDARRRGLLLGRRDQGNAQGRPSLCRPTSQPRSASNIRCSDLRRCRDRAGRDRDYLNHDGRAAIVLPASFSKATHDRHQEVCGPQFRPGRVQAQCLASQLEEAETFDDALNGPSWSNLVDKIIGHDKSRGPGDRIEVWKPDTGAFGEMIITEIGPGYVRANFIRAYEPKVAEISRKMSRSSPAGTWASEPMTCCAGPTTR
jgi:hypothetical protein